MRRTCLLLVLLAGCSGSTDRAAPVFPRDRPPEEKAVAPEPRPQEKPVEVTVRELIEAYDENEIAADQKYRGKLLEVFGWVGAVRRDWIGLNLVEGRTSSVVCMIDADSRGLFAEARKDEDYRVVGRCLGMERRVGAWKDKIVVLEHSRPAGR